MLVAVVATGLLAACGGSDDGGGGELFVVYKKSGGISGINERLICSEKRCWLTESGHPRGVEPLSAAEADRLREAFDRAEFQNLPSETGTPCADCFRYRIEYAGHSVRTEQSALPDDARPLIAELDALVKRVHRGNT